jgi:hypothetical protein
VSSVGAELGQHLMRFSLMENYLEHAEVIAFLASLGEALDGFVRGMEQFVAARQADDAARGLDRSGR